MAEMQDTTGNEPTGDEDASTVETTPVVADENEDNKPTGDESTETANEDEDDSGSEDDDTSQTGDDDKPVFKKRFTQFKGDTADEYLPNLEEAHAKSITEAQRLVKENKDLKKESDSYNKMLDFINANPEVKKAIEQAGQNVAEAKPDPAIEYAREQMNNSLQQEYDKFADSHPDMLTDEEVKNAVLDELEAIDQVYAARGRKLSMTEGLKKAWSNLYGEQDKKDAVMNEAKNEASKPATQGTPKPNSNKPEFSEKQLAIAKKMGVSPEQLEAANKK